MSLGSLIWFAFLCVLPMVLFAGAIVWLIRYNAQARLSGQELATRLGMPPITESKDPQQVWYGGEHNGREVAFRPVAKRERSYSGSGYTTSTRFWLQIAMAVQGIEPLKSVVISGRSVSADPDQSFEDVFTTDDPNLVSAEAQVAMLEFVRKGYPTGLTGTTFRMNKGIRSLALYGRAEVPDGLAISADVLPKAPALLLHDHYDSTLSAEAFGALLDDMVIVAQAVESSAA
ncbi:MAG: hypothetical protein R3C44_03970 [Chloroflexota bacterium]